MLRMWAKIVQHRLAFLIGVLLIAAAVAVLQQRKSVPVYEACTILAFLLTVGMFIGALAALNARHPETFLARDGGFSTPPDANAVLMTAGLTMLIVTNVGRVAALAHSGFGLDYFDIASLAVTILLLPLAWYRVLGPFGAVLRSDGLLDRQPFGSVFVPWEAGLAAEPTTVGVKLRFARPELVKRRGLGSGRKGRPGASIRTGADRGFTAWAINLYAARPEYRPTIGTSEGLLLLKPR